MSRLFQEIASKVIGFGGRVFKKAFGQAYQQAKSSAKAGEGGKQVAKEFGKGMRKKMPTPEAFEVLNIKPKNASFEEAYDRYKVLFKQNDPDTGGSFYLQSKVWAALETLKQEFPEEDVKEVLEKKEQEEQNADAKEQGEDTENKEDAEQSEKKKNETPNVR